MGHGEATFWARQDYFDSSKAKYKNKEMKKAKRLLQAVEWLEQTHDTKMQDEVIKKFN